MAPAAETTLSKVLSQHAVQPDPELLQRLNHDKSKATAAMNGKSSSPIQARPRMRQYSSKVSKQTKSF